MKIEKLMIYILGALTGIMLGHLQEQKWSEQKQNALLAQIEEQSCEDGNPYKGKEHRFYDSPSNSKRQ